MNILEEAIIYSTIMHQGKSRKLKGAPYILHPLEVAQILSMMTNDLEVITAGVLHDVVEDTDGTLEEVRKRFGERIAMLVDSESENKYPGKDKTATWRQRKEESLQVLKDSKDIGVKMLWLADKLSNLRSLAVSYGEIGDKIWDSLNQHDPAQHRWYYQTIAEYLEMELNRTGAYKEFIQHINYIWPGTFDSQKTRYKKYREVSLEGCRLIGRGAQGEVYRYDDELIVKVYNDSLTFKDVEKETRLARKAFVLGLPTAISFGIVSVGSRYGAMYELVNARTVSEQLSHHPERAEYYAGVMANLAREIHEAEVSEEDGFPSSTDILLERVKRGILQEDSGLAEKLNRMILAMPPTNHLVHGDFHTGNIFIQENDTLLIDMDRLSTGHPIVDLSNLYLFYIAYGENDPSKLEDYMGFSCETARILFDSFLKKYLQTEDENLLRKVRDQAALLAYIRLVGQILKSRHLSAADQKRKKELMDRIRELADRVTSLEIGS